MKPKLKKDTRVLSITFDAKSDAGYIYLIPQEEVKDKYTHTKPYDHGVNLDLDKDGYIIGVEVLWVREQIKKWLELPKPKDPNLLSAYPRKGPLKPVSAAKRKKMQNMKIDVGEHASRVIDQRLGDGGMRKVTKVFFP
jgi:uncharacterized protein YuzE